MVDKQPKVFVMGEEVAFETMPEADAVSIEDYFAPVKLSGPAIDRASQIVPEEHWKPRGIYTWLEGRANLAFRKLDTSSKQITMGRLRYTYEYTAEGPVLKMVALV